MVAALYCLRADLAEEIQVNDPNEDTRLDRAITDASRVIDAFCRQQPGTFAPQTDVRYFDSPVWPSSTFHQERNLNSYTWFNSLPVLNSRTWFDSLRVPPLLSVTELATDANHDGVYETIWTSPTDYLLLPYNREVKRQINTNALTGRFFFPVGQQTIRVTGSWGITEDGLTPYAIRRACLLLAMIYYRRPTNPANSSGLGGAAASIGYTDPDIAAILWRVAGAYRETFVGV